MYQLSFSICAAVALLLACSGDGQTTAQQPTLSETTTARAATAPSGGPQVVRQEGAGGPIVTGTYSCVAHLTQPFDTVEIHSQTEYETSYGAGEFTYDPESGLMHFQTGGWSGGFFTRGEFYAAGTQGEGQGPQFWLYFEDGGSDEADITCYGPD